MPSDFGAVNRSMCLFLLKRNSVFGGSCVSLMKMLCASTEFESKASLKKIEIVRKSPVSSTLTPMAVKFPSLRGIRRPLKFIGLSGEGRFGGSFRAASSLESEEMLCAKASSGEKNAKMRKIDAKNKIVFFIKDSIARKITFLMKFLRLFSENSFIFASLSLNVPFRAMRYSLYCQQNAGRNKKRLKNHAFEEKIMKKTVFTTVAVAALVFGLGANSAFAKTPVRTNPFNRPVAVNSEKGFPSRAPKTNGLKDGTHFAKNPRQNPHAQPKADLLGTVSTVNAETKILTVKDADGKETQVHVSPLTRIGSLPTEEERKAAAEAKKSGEKKIPAQNTLALSDVKSGDFVVVKKIDTETKTLEAARIIIAREK